MPVATAVREPLTRHTPRESGPGELREVADLLRTAGEHVARLDLDDPYWGVVGPLLTALVCAVREALPTRDGLAPPLTPADDVVPVLRVRDLARASQRVRRSGAVVLPQVTLATLRSRATALQQAVAGV